MRTLMWMAIGSTVLASVGFAQDLLITDIRPNALTWDTPTDDARYDLEWSPNNGVWTNDWTGFNDIAPTSNPTTVSVPMSYRLSERYRNLAHWPLWETNGTSAAELTGGLIGSLIGSGNEWQGGVGGTGICLQVTGEYIDAGDAFDLGTGVLSFSCWVKTSPGDDGQALIAKTLWPGDYDGYWVGLHWSLTSPAGRPVIILGDGNGDARVFGTTRIDDDEWHHLVAILHRSKLPEIYLDGNPDIVTQDHLGATWESLAWLDSQTSTSFTLGATADPGTRKQLHGCLSNVRVYRGILSPERIQGLLLEGPSPR